MSDMIVREIPGSNEVPELELAVRELEQTFQKDKVTQAKAKKPRKGEIVFEGPSAQEIKATENEKASPLTDVAGRDRWIVTRECWCNHDAKDECRFHHMSEKGWATCPNKPPESHLNADNARQPRKLWATNPEFGKARDLEEVLAEGANDATAKVVEAA